MSSEEPSALEIAERLPSMVRELVEDFTISRELLRRIIIAKREDEPDPEAWALAFELVDKWAAVASGEPVKTTARCPECRAVIAFPLVMLDGAPRQPEPTRIECGPEHLLHFDGYTIASEAGICRVIRDDPATVIGSHARVFYAPEGDGDGDVSS